MTTAQWALPSGSLEGPQPGPDDPPIEPFGTGTEIVELLRDTSLDPDVEQFYEINTEVMAIRFISRTVDGEFVTTLLIDNPGEEAGEFHFATLRIGEDVRVTARGDRPLVIRLLGGGLNADPADVVFQVDANGVLTASGEPGLDSPQAGGLGTPKPGGVGGAGGGNGGDGAEVDLVGTPAVPVALTDATAGGNFGGGPGESTLALDYRTILSGQGQSRFTGGPGGGGGCRFPGGDGHSGTPSPEEYAPPRPGRGGAPRGDPRLLTLPAGSGGGGGGATFSLRATGGMFEFEGVTGASGGGGGGVIHVVANGSMVIDGRVESDGGKGGDGVTRVDNRPTGHGAPGAGGGGSGGSILLQAQGTILVDCSNLSADGGLHGTSNEQNEVPGAGDGSPGWIRVEAERRRSAVLFRAAGGLRVGG